MTAIQTARGHGSRRRLHPRSKKSPRRMVLAQIREARSKAYGLDAIAKILSESGVTASASLVRDLLTEGNAPLLSGLDGPSKSARLRKSPVAGVRVQPRHEPSSGASDSKRAPEGTRATTPERSIRPAATGDGVTPYGSPRRSDSLSCVGRRSRHDANPGASKAPTQVKPTAVGVVPPLPVSSCREDKPE